MKDLSLPRLALLLWFVNYSVYALVNYLARGGHEIGTYLVVATVFMVLELVGMGLIEDME